MKPFPIIMKILPVIPLALLCLGAPAQEANPFVNQPPQKAAPLVSGEPFINLTENILVSSDLLDAWLEEHPLKEDATELRAAVQKWIAEGKASLDHTAVTAGTSGLDCTNESILEQIYPTEFEPPKPGEWPMGTSFETRNVGYSLEGSAAVREGAMVLLANAEFVRMLPHQAPHPLAEATREPDDVFIPRFQTIQIKQSPVKKGKPEAEENDPFNPAKPPAQSRKISQFNPGRIHLVARADDELPKPVIDPHATPAEVEKFVEEHRAKHAGVRQVRLMFFRGVIAKGPNPPQPQITGNYPVSARFVLVDHRLFSDWLQTQDLAAVAGSAAGAVEGWKKDGKAEVISTLTSNGRAGSKTSFGDWVEVSYPTEWEPVEGRPAGDGKQLQQEFSIGTSFETRYTGLQVDTTVVADPKGPLLEVFMERVIRGGDSVNHRIFRDGKWQADIKFPVFTSTRWNTHLRLVRGQWMLAGSGAAVDAKGKFDPGRTVLAFVKVE